jgi:hypothetical protein
MLVRDGLRGRVVRPVRDAHQGRDVALVRDGLRDRDEQPVRGGHQGRDVQPVRDGHQGRDVRPVRGGHQGRDVPPVRGGHQGRDVPPVRGGHQGRDDHQVRDDHQDRDEPPARDGPASDDRPGLEARHQGDRRAVTDLKVAGESEPAASFVGKGPPDLRPVDVPPPDRAAAGPGIASRRGTALADRSDLRTCRKGTDRGRGAMPTGAKRPANAHRSGGFCTTQVLYDAGESLRSASSGGGSIAPTKKGTPIGVPFAFRIRATCIRVGGADRA